MLNFKYCNRFLLLASMLLSGITSSCSAMNFQTARKTPIRIYYTAWPGDYPLVLADALGYYDKYGLDVELIPIKSRNDGFIEFINSQVDTLNINLRDDLLIAQTEDIQIVWLQDNTLDTLVSIPTIATPNDLRGKRIGLDTRTGIGELFIEAILKINNLTLQDVTLVHFLPDEVPSALGKQIDAGYTWNPYTEEAIAGGNKILLQLPSQSPDVMIFKKSFIDEHSDNLRALVEAWSESVLYWEANPTKSVELIASFYGVTPEELSLGVEEGVDTYSRQQNIEALSPSSVDSIYDVAKVNLDYLVTTGSVWRLPDISTLINNEFLGKLESSN